MSGQPAGKNKKRKAQALTRRQLALVKAKVADPDLKLSKAGRKAGYRGDDNIVSSVACRTLKLPTVRERFQQLMAKRKKLQHASLLKKMEEGLDATTTKFFAHEGEIQDQAEVVDYATRHSYLALVAKLGGLEENKLELTGAGGKDLIPPAAPSEALPQLSKEQLLALLALETEEPPVGGAKPEGSDRPA